MIDPPRWEDVLDEESIPPGLVADWMRYWESVPDFPSLARAEGCADDAMALLETMMPEP